MTRLLLTAVALCVLALCALAFGTRPAGAAEKKIIQGPTAIHRALKNNVGRQVVVHGVLNGGGFLLEGKIHSANARVVKIDNTPDRRALGPDGKADKFKNLVSIPTGNNSFHLTQIELK